MKIFRTGIVPLDAQLGGGIPSGSVVALIEEPGAGGDVFSYHFAVEGSNLGDNVLYIATDDSVKDVRRYLSLYFPRYQDFTLISLKSDEETDAKGYLRKTMYDVLSGVKTIIKNEKFDRVIINNLTFFFSRYSLEDVISLIEFFLNDAREKESAYMLLLTKGMLEERAEIAVKHFCDGVIELSLREVENEIQRRLKFIKFKGIIVPRAVMRYELTDRGVKIEPMMRVL
ncbi:MAG: RAD55 family ATPase [Archaeoglobaceae archaeon]|uniref:KaiC-like domain-containing protein n=1 Tax=Archaeoglobus fulgidus TaxID=2234 RepID=A0A7J3M1F3_ARCFL